MEIYCAVLEDDCEPHYFDSKEKAFNYIWNSFHKCDYEDYEIEELREQLSTPDDAGYYELPDYGYYSKIDIE